MASITAKKVESLIKPTVEAMGYSLWDVCFVKEGASHYLRIFIDKAEGIDINDCTDVSHAVDPIIDEADPIKTAYYLEVCSPGINRELTKDEHLSFAVNKKVLLRTVRPVENIKEFTGTLLSFNKEQVVLEGEKTFLRQNIASIKLSEEL